MSVQLARLEVRTSDGVVIASITGEIDMSNAVQSGQAVLAPMRNETVGLVLDLAELTYLDSAGIRVIYDLNERLQDRGQKLALVVPPQAPTMGALRLTGVLELVPVVATADEAEAAVRAGS